ncbi:MAG: MurR/RpiR family transcriptional regulator [Chloroflexota bacterium]
MEILHNYEANNYEYQTEGDKGEIAEHLATSGRIQLTSCLARIQSALTNHSLFPAERKIAEYVMKYPEEVTAFSVNELARVADASEATIVRFCRALAFSGYKDFKMALAAEAKGAVKITHEEINRDDDVMSITRKVFQSDLQAIADSRETLDRHEMERAVEAIHRAKRTEFYGMGSSAPAAFDAYYRFLKIGLPVFYVLDPYMQAVSASQLGPDCVAFAISHTGRTDGVIFSLRKAREAGATTIALTSNVRGPIAEFADIKLITAARETAFRNQAMASRIAHLSVIDALYVNVAVRRYNKASEQVRHTEEVINEKLL